MDESCPPCPKCWSAYAVRILSTTKDGTKCQCRRCGTVWYHDATRIAAILNEDDPAEPSEPR